MPYSVLYDPGSPLPGPTRKLFYIDPDVNGLGVNAHIWASGGGFAGDGLLQAGPGFFSTADYEVIRYLLSCDIPRVHYIQDLPSQPGDPDPYKGYGPQT